MNCGETAGFLIPRACREPATGACGRCGKAICGFHVVAIETGEQLCTACAATAGQGPGVEREQLHQQYGFHEVGPGYPGRALPTYTEGDYAAFEVADLADDALVESLDGS